MSIAHDKAAACPAWHGGDRGLVLLILGALVLILVGLISIPLVARLSLFISPILYTTLQIAPALQIRHIGDYASAQ
jgi:uncharacterized membrane protein YuzA (DUF378 family)